MSGAVTIDEAWLAAHPLPRHEQGIDKNDRGRVLLIGGARFVPGALRLTGEAALRAGAGKVQMATVDSVAAALGVLVPEAAMIALPMREDGEIAPAAVAVLKDLGSRCDLMLVGPGMSATEETEELVRGLIALAPPAMLLDAAAMTCADLDEMRAASESTTFILTPHHGEMATLTEASSAKIAAAPEAAARDLSARSGAIVALKGAETWIATPDGDLLHFTGGCPGLATGGSGDVLAGVIGGLVARGADPLAATAWGVWAHGRAGQLLSEAISPLGFLARELLPHVPRLLHGGGDGQ